MPTTSFDNPFLPADLRWTGVVLLLIAGWLLASAAVGLAARALGEADDTEAESEFPAD